MKVKVTEEPITTLEEYAAIPIEFEVEVVLDVADPGDGNREFILTERRLDVSYIKDYDTIDGEDPVDWSRRFDISKWGSLAARARGRRIGGAIVAFDTPEVTLSEGRNDVAVLWDIRVAPDARGQGIGSALFRSVEALTRARGCRQLKVETQNINVPACRFYARHGCVLSAIDRFAYPELPDEIQMIWLKELIHD